MSFQSDIESVYKIQLRKPRSTIDCDFAIFKNEKMIGIANQFIFNTPVEPRTKIPLDIVNSLLFVAKHFIEESYPFVRLRPFIFVRYTDIDYRFNLFDLTEENSTQLEDKLLIDTFAFDEISKAKNRNRGGSAVREKTVERYSVSPDSGGTK